MEHIYRVKSKPGEERARMTTGCPGLRCRPSDPRPWSVSDAMNEVRLPDAFVQFRSLVQIVLPAPQGAAGRPISRAGPGGGAGSH